jgi:hypothetical protein
MKKKIVFPAVCILLWFQGGVASGYPIDGYPGTGIRRLARLSLIADGKLPGTLPPPGARRPLSEISLNLLGPAGDALSVLPAPDPGLQKQIGSLFPDRHESYALALMDITPGKPVRVALRQADRQLSPGSVGKLAIAAGLFKELGSLYPDSTERRKELLRERKVVAGRWIHTDHHDVPIYDPEARTFASRPIREGDVFSLYEWVDHMLSASANAAASTVWKELMLMRHFGSAYPPAPDQEEAFFRDTPRTALRDMAMSIVNDPLRESGISQDDWQLGSFFTGTGKRLVPPGGKSYATPRGLLAFLVAVERGLLVDEWSSLELKRLMYMTARRIRYASSPALANAAVYFKSGSQYKCKPEPDFKCGKYMGNVENYMNSVAIIEHPDGRVYLVAIMSNVLRKNSAVEHQSLATFIERILSK